MYNRIIIILIVILISDVSDLYSQTPAIETNNLQLENIAGENDENIDLSELEEQRLLLQENPIDLNHSTESELTASGLFDEQQSEIIIDHIAENGKLICLEELQSMPGFDLAFIISVLPYVKLNGYFIDPHLRFSNLLKNGRSQFIFRTQKIMEEQKGFAEREDGSRAYVGDPYRMYSRFRFTAGRYFSIGITAEKDAGETFFGNRNKNGLDFYSFHLFLHPGKFVKTLALGDYQVQFGQGLVVWSGLAFGKSSEVISIKKQAAGIKPYTSSNEFGFLRGAAIGISYKFINCSSWISYRKLDANIEVSDSLSEEEITSVGTAGYHRTTYEIEDRNKLDQFTAGINLQFVKRNFSIGYTSEFLAYNMQLQKGSEMYELFNAYGNKFFNQGINYNFLWKNFSLFGEAATDKDGNIAYLNGLIISADRRVSFSLLQRNYPGMYNAIHSNAFREGSKVKNEKAVYAGLQVQLLRTLKASFYNDIFTFPWLRYQSDAPTNGHENLLQLTYTPARTTELYVRLKREIKQENESYHLSVTDAQPEIEKINLRVNISFKVARDFILQNRVEKVTLKGRDLNESGTFFMQEIIYKPMGKAYSISACYSLFNTGSYDSRLYAYEQDLPGAAAIPSFYYCGNRYCFILRYRILRGFDTGFKIGRTVYSNMKQIGSGNDLINADHKTEIKLQFRYSF